MVVAALACRAAPVSSDTPTAAPAATSALRASVDGGHPSAFSRCEPPPADIPQLTSFMGIDPSHPYWVPVIFEGHTWLPAEPIRPPHHHGSRLELDNLEAFPMLDRQRGRRLRFTLSLTTTDVQKVPDRMLWRSTYHATILAICELVPR
jgi:hypothetical protein